MRHLPIAERRKRNEKIRELYASGLIQRRIGERFGLCQKTVSQILEEKIK